ncbi:DNA-binding transcriptional activator UhpA [Serratia marcescens]|uniref:helix-turn-helix transcriptional regulator n=1 Tax=Serratia marcescens TaxID=615 RepID=UPI000E1C76C2|nr:LuxR family transcriptional regulator [Serratia marcescens]AXK22119.1 LuxR family transcriptional regulator [Serratia marcescens]MBH2526197.1 helix-turn-helix transcriptional regulator [Serratia marcescens]MBH2888067.1 helix-turn-helix transcriptional regulator [Serratia marcescens]MBH2998649.1 helix-turn-helix transcriptional regulator [Serratia marcescens]MBH3137825.1 helix-turn-helix transcriptional regulator [Serratia marcescens]
MREVSIVIDDENHYFSVGLEESIREYALAHNKVVKFLSPNAKDEIPDVIIASPACYLNRCKVSPPFRAGHVVLSRERKHSPALGDTITLYRKDDRDTLFSLLNGLFSCPAKNGSRQRLSRREKQVIDYLRQGLDQSQTARIMGVSVKTVHSHKRSVMSKMMLHGKHDFLYWLLAKESVVSYDF